MMKNLTKTLLLTSVFATASVIAMEAYNNGESPVQQPELSPEMEAFRPIAEAVFRDDDYLNDFLKYGNPTIEDLIERVLMSEVLSAQEIHERLGEHANGMTVEDIQGIIDREEQRNEQARLAAMEAYLKKAYRNGGSEYNN